MKILMEISILLLIVFFIPMPAQQQPKAEEYCMPVEITSVDIAETTNSFSELPAFLSYGNAFARETYAIAAAHYDLLQWIPCYCGCGQTVQHKNNRDCFIRGIKRNGQVVWDSHAMNCMNCLEIAREAAALQDAGKSIYDIRNYIDNKYKVGYAKPTPTPMPN
ncbi:PCYCGC motif-containing (lipo)protein [Bacillus sp. 165]|uniref:PCYCGC motif-containing (lipo)protein n=1 Tax=Bacillus sp. 165 TaxID=1529117 RepID=UPI001ADA5F26|nr:PCYCGC motif-containing (lipo)protein [Bacillus sp. 165]MBO9128376.1 hypothetical protein [Bacillus sp. 165]